MFAGCWCTKCRPDCAEKDRSVEGNREFERRLVAEGLARLAGETRPLATGAVLASLADTLMPEAYEHGGLVGERIEPDHPDSAGCRRGRSPLRGVAGRR